MVLQWLSKEQWTLTVTTLVTLYLVASYSRSITTKKSKLPQPASTLPLIGNTLDTIKKQKHRLYDWVAEESTKVHGKPWLLTVIGRPKTIVVTSPELYEDVLRHQVDFFQRGEPTCFLLRDIFGRGILAVDGDEWYFQRKTASHLFSLQMMKDIMQEIVREKTLILCENMAYYAKEKRQHVSLKREMGHFTSDVFNKIGFGVDLRCLEMGRDGPLSNGFVAAFSFCSHVLQSRTQQPFWLWRLKRYLNIGEEKEFKRCMQTVNELMYQIIGDSMEKKNHSDASGKTLHSKDLISLFLHSKLKSEMNQDTEREMELIRDMTINFVFSGKDTTSQNMTWFLIMMNRYPNVAKKIREELREQVPGLMKSADGKMQIPTMDELKKLTYLEAAIRENLRLYPAVPITARTANTSTVLSDGTVVAKGTRVALATYAAGRQTSVWGEDACEFKPERWIDPITNTLTSISPFKFSSFLAGPRMCIGMKFAMLEMKIALAAILSRFDLKTVEDPWKITYQIGITYMVKGPVEVNVIPIEQ